MTCPSLNLENGWIRYTSSLLNGGYPVYTEAFIYCNWLHNREGASSVICQNSGNWNPQAPTCNESNEQLHTLLYKYLNTV